MRKSSSEWTPTIIGSIQLTQVRSPDRWNSPPEASSTIPGAWGNQFTFGGGPRACIGLKFAIIEYVHSN